MNQERNISVQKSNYNVVDSEFDSMRDRFEAEMRRVEEEMKRLRSEFEGYSPGFQQPALAQHPANAPHRQQHHTSSTQSSTYTGTGSTGGALQPRHDPYFDQITSPLIRDESDGKTLRLRFNVNQYKPEEVTVKTVDNRLLVQAKHEEKDPARSVFREYNQEFMLPRGTNPEMITSSLSVDGVLTVEAPLPPSQRPMPITQH